MSKVVDLGEEDEIEEMMAEGQELVVDLGEKNEELEGVRVDKRQVQREKKRQFEEQKQQEILAQE